MIDDIEESTDTRECLPLGRFANPNTPTTHQRQALPPKVEDDDFDFDGAFAAETGGITSKSDREKALEEETAAAAAATAAAAGGAAAGGGAAGGGAGGAAGAGALATE